MRINHLLIHRATLVIPGGEETRDPYGRPVYSDPATRVIPCRLDQLRQTTSKDEEGNDVLWSYVLFAGPNKTFTNDMQIRDVVDKQGNVVASGTFNIVQIFPVYSMRRLHHFEINLSRGDGSIA